MSSTFGSLETSRSGLNASQLGMNVTSQNLANSDTPGYTREALDVSAISPDSGIYMEGSSGPKVGMGVDVNSVYQIRDSFLDVRYRYENSQYNLYNGMESQLTPIEDQFNEVGDSTTDTNELTGLSGQLDGVIKALNEYSTDPTDTTISSDIMTSVDNLVSSIQDDASYLNTTMTDEKNELSIYVDGGTGDTSNGDNSSGVNGLIDNIQDLNKQIADYEVGGQTANDLRDQRNELLDQLSNYVDINTTEESNGMVSVTLQNDSSESIIDSDNNANEFRVGTYTDPTTGTTNTVLKWGDSISSDGTRTAAPDDSDSTPPADVEGGLVKAYLNVINGNGSGTDDPANGVCGNVGIPYLMTKLNDFAVSFMNTMNNAGNSVVSDPDATSGTQFITYDDGGTDYVSDGTPVSTSTDVASSIKVEDAWKDKSDLFIDNYKEASPGDYYNDYYNALSSATGTVTETADDGTTSPFDGTISGFADTFSEDLASSVNSVTEKATSHSTNADNLDDQRQSISSVSTNDEAVNIIKYQQSYNANARVITAIDEMLDTLINSTGSVGISG